MSDSELSLPQYFSTDHTRCDDIWSEVEAAADRQDAKDIAAHWQRFESAMRRHFEMEEQVLFPAFESATGITQGPTEVMRSEHAQMRALLDQLAGAVREGDFDQLLDLGDTLLMLIQQHNQKEEHMLYPLSERALAAEWPKLRAELGRF